MSKIIKISIFILGIAITFGKFILSIKSKKEIAVNFRNSWNTEFVGEVIDKIDITNDVGLLKLNTLSIEGNYMETKNFSPQKFYFIADTSRAFLIEGGVSEINIKDIVTLTKSGDIIIVRENSPIISRPIFFRDSDVLWDDFNFDLINQPAQ